MPRAALLSINARVLGTNSSAWEHPSLVQLWGPRFSNYVVAAKDLPVFSLGRMPGDDRRRARAQDTASRLHALLEGRRMLAAEAERALGLRPNMLRYAAPTGTVLIRWDGAREPDVWSGPPHDIEPHEARLELARRYLHIFGPSTAASFAHWAGIGPSEAKAAFDALAGMLAPTRTPAGDTWMLAEDESAFRQPVSTPPAPARLLPSGDTHFLLWSADRALLVPDERRRAELWTTRVWPGALLVNGEVAGVWRRSAAEVSIDAWRRLSPAEWEVVEAEAAALPLPGVNGRITIHRN
jgi:hypothetical protein